MHQRGYELFSYLPIRGLYHSALHGGVHDMFKGLLKKDAIALKKKKKSLQNNKSETCVESNRYQGPTPLLIIISSPSEWNKQTQEQELLSVPLEERAG